MVQDRVNRNLALDGLRGLAALSVLVFHVWMYARQDPGAVVGSLGNDVFNEMRLGLILFFVLSGFLLYGPWVRAVHEGSGRPNTRRYLIRRAARIVPAYYVAIIGSVALLWGFGETQPLRLPPASDLWLFFVFAQNFSSATVMTLNPPTWTLGIEASFYLALPLIGLAALALPRTRRWQACVPLVLIAGGLVWNHQTGLGMPQDKVLPAMLPYFGAGMLAALMLHGRELGHAQCRWLMIGGALAVVANGVVDADVFDGSVVHFIRTTPRDLLAATGFAAIMAAAAASVERRPILASRPLASLGTISYGVYLWHTPILWALLAAGLLPLAWLPALPIVLALAIAAGAISWFAVERPAIRWAHSATRHSRRPATAIQRRPALASRAS